MSDTSKTFAFLTAGVVSVITAVMVGRSSQPPDVRELVGSRLNDFDVEAPKSLRIVKYNADSAEVREFEVAEQQGIWTIPSKQGYPADATTQMAQASTCLMDREVLRIQTKTAQDHEELGVVDPSASNLGPTAEGVGARVIMKDADERSLVDMIIGKKVKGTDDQHYVRKSTQDIVYVVQLDPEQLSTDFADWIEDDLLQLNTIDVQKIFINDYSASMQVVLNGGRIERQISWDPRGEMTLAYDNSASEWTAENLRAFDPDQGGMAPYELGEDEQLNEDALRELRNGLDDLQIVDVERKPDGLGGDLKAGDQFLNDREAIENLRSRGFMPAAIDGVDEIISSEGEIVCTMKNGVEYVLRFGKLQVGAGGEGSNSEDASGEGEAAADSVGEEGINRYLFVMAQFNEAAIEQPDLKDLPELPAGVSAEDLAAGAEEEDADNSEDATSESEASEEADSDDAAGAEEESGESDAQTDESEVDDGNSSEDEASSDESDADDDETDMQKIIAERKLIEQENQRLLDEYDEKITEGKEKVAELNDRFGDWYYVISNEFYKQIHLGRDAVIEKMEAETTDDATSADPTSGGPLSGLPELPLPDVNGGEQPASEEAEEASVDQ